MRERVMLLGAGRMLLMQMGYPAVSAGVRQHSNYTSDPWSRVRHTTDFYLRLVHARSCDLPELRAWLSRAHQGVSGVDDQGRAYKADQAEHMLWVHASVADSVLWVYQQVFGDLDRGQLSRYWMEQRILAIAMGLPAEQVPSSARGWQGYIAETSRQLSVDPGTLEVFNLIKSLPPQGPRRIPAWAWSSARPWVARANLLFTRAGMPSALRGELMVYRSAKEQVRFRRLCRLLRWGLRILPPELRFSSRARVSQRAALSRPALSAWQA